MPRAKLLFSASFWASSYFPRLWLNASDLRFLVEQRVALTRADRHENDGEVRHTRTLRFPPLFFVSAAASSLSLSLRLRVAAGVTLTPSVAFTPLFRSFHLFFSPPRVIARASARAQRTNLVVRRVPLFEVLWWLRVRASVPFFCVNLLLLFFSPFAFITPPTPPVCTPSPLS